MGLSPAPHEQPAKAVDEKVPPGSLNRFQRLASRLFGTDRAEFREALEKDEAERRAKRGR
jgi:hypothetical protein